VAARRSGAERLAPWTLGVIARDKRCRATVMTRGPKPALRPVAPGGCAFAPGCTFNSGAGL